MTYTATTVFSGKRFSNAAPLLILLVCSGVATNPFRYSNGIDPETFVIGSNQPANYMLAGEATDIVISDLGTNKYALTTPLVIALKQEHDDEYVASFVKAELSRSGETPMEAIDWLKSSVVTLYELLKKRAPEQLGPLPTRQLQILGEYLVAKPNPPTSARLRR